MKKTIKAQIDHNKVVSLTFEVHNGVLNIDSIFRAFKKKYNFTHCAIIK